MRKALILGACALALVAVPATVVLVASAKPAAAAASTNPLLAPWAGPYGGVPAFDKVKVSDFDPAFDAAIAENRAEIEAIANNPAPPTFENTIVALERSGRTLSRVTSVYGVWRSNLSTPEFQKAQDVIEPKLAAFQDEVIGNAKLFARIDAVYATRGAAGLDPVQKRLTWVYWNNFVKQGAKLTGADKARVAEINQRLATLFAKFSQNLQGDEAGYTLFLKASDMSGLPQGVKDAAAAAAEERGHKGEFAIVNTRSSMDPFLTYSDRRDLREKVWKTYYNRGDNGDARDNNALIKEILKLRAEKARILGYKTFAHWKLSDKMVKDPDQAMDLMLKIWAPAVARVHQEVADMQAIADKEGAGIKIAPWDYRYYAEKVRKAKYDLDQNEVKPYLQLDNIRKAMFWTAQVRYGFTFTPVKGLPVFHPDVTTYEVKRNGKHVGYWYFDPYARDGKDSGAWETAYRVQDKLDGGHYVVLSNNSNFIKGKPGEPVLISWTDAETMFHEFGHAIHELSSNVTYPSLAGTNTATDFVEFPSQVNEHWLSTPEVLSRFLVNAKGQPMPAALAAKIEKASTFNQGFAVTEFMASALIDMKLHLAGGADIDPDAFERDTLKELGMPEELVMRHRTPQFGHVFSSDGYAAGYYSYFWSEVLDQDAYQAFVEAGGPYDKTVSKRFFDDILSVGNTVDPADAFRKFRGRDPKIDAYLRAKGFPVQGQ